MLNEFGKVNCFIHTVEISQEEYLAISLVWPDWFFVKEGVLRIMFYEDFFKTCIRYKDVINYIAELRNGS